MGKNIDKCYSDSASSETTVKRKYADFKWGRTDTNDVSENTKKTPQTCFGQS